MAHFFVAAGMPRVIQNTNGNGGFISPGTFFSSFFICLTFFCPSRARNELAFAPFGNMYLYEIFRYIFVLLFCVYFMSNYDKKSRWIYFGETHLTLNLSYSSKDYRINIKLISVTHVSKLPISFVTLLINLR